MLESYCRSPNGSICFCLSIYRYDVWADALNRDVVNSTSFFSSVLGLALLVDFTNDGDDWWRAEKKCHASCLRIHYSCLSASYSGLLVLLLSGCPKGIGKPSQWDDQSSTQGAGLIFWHQPHWPHLKSFLQRHQEYGRFPSRTISLRSPVMSAFFQRHLSLSSNKCVVVFSLHSFDNLLCLPCKILSEVITRDQEAGGHYKQSSVFTSCWYCGRSGSDSLLRNGRWLPEEVLSVSNSYKHFCVLSKIDHVLVCITSFGQNWAKKL